MTFLVHGCVSAIARQVQTIRFHGPCVLTNKLPPIVRIRKRDPVIPNSPKHRMYCRKFFVRAIFPFHFCTVLFAF